jgi:uncharacterized protein GlcG (DUF336 family)
MQKACSPNRAAIDSRAFGDVIQRQFFSKIQEDCMTKSVRKSMFVVSLVLVSSLVLGVGIAQAQGPNNASRNGCQNLPSWEQLKQALTDARKESNGGLNFDMWGTIVDRDGVVCAVAFTGADRGSQWPGSRVISAQKANTANAFSLPKFALSTANLYTATQPGGSLFGLQLSNPVSTDIAYSGSPDNYGQKNDGMVGGRIGGVNVFGGGLGLYNSSKQLVGAIGVSGDTSCADHNIAYRTRHGLLLDYVPAGVSPDPDRKDNIIFDITPQGNGDAAPIAGQMPGVSTSGFGHASCFGYDLAGNDKSADAAKDIPKNR